MLFAYKEKLYTKDNILITIAGNISDQAKLEEQIAQLFSSLPEKKSRQKPDFQTWRKKMKTCCMFFTIKQQKLNIITRLNQTYLVNIASIDTK